MKIDNAGSSIFSLSRLHSHYTSHAQLVASTNVANISTPAFKAGQVPDFRSWARLDQGIATMQQTPNMGRSNSQFLNRTSTDANASTLSGNTVSIESELQRAGEIRRMHNLNASVVKSFHRMFIASLKG